MIADPDAQYLSQKKVPKLLDDMASELLLRKPLDAKQHLLQWLTKLEEREREANRLMDYPSSLHVAMPDATAVQIDAAALRGLLQEHANDGTLRVVDLREDVGRGGRCPAAIHAPYSSLLSGTFDYIPPVGTTLVLVSARGGDGIAAEVAQVVCARGDDGTTTRDVCVLLGGWEAFFRQYHADPTLVTDYDAAAWK